MRVRAFMHVRVCACVRVRLCMRVRACACVHARACVRVRACAARACVCHPRVELVVQVADAVQVEPADILTRDGPEEGCTRLLRLSSGRVRDRHELDVGDHDDCAPGD